nr:hypothetical protein [Nitrosomonas nitrosa]
MPIINTKKKGENPSGGNQHSSVGAEALSGDFSAGVGTKTKEPSKPKKILLPVILSIAALSAVGGAYYAVNHASLLDSSSNEPVELDQAQVVQESVELDPVQIVQEIDRFAKLGGMISLTEKEIEVNTVTLVEAENVGSSVTMNAVEIILNKKKKELSELRDKAVATLMALYEFSQKNQEQTSTIFKEQMDEAKKGEKALRLEQLQTALDAINSVPPIRAPQEHFKGMVESRL